MRRHELSGKKSRQLSSRHSIERHCLSLQRSRKRLLSGRGPLRRWHVDAREDVLYSNFSSTLTVGKKNNSIERWLDMFLFFFFFFFFFSIHGHTMNVLRWLLTMMMYI